ncbi:MAG: agmatinase, partial [Phycisphaerae bacterium]
AKVVLLPVPYDGTSTYAKGADKGPAAILDASCQLENYDIETRSEPYRQGIYADKPVTENSSPEKMAQAVEKRVGQLLSADKFVVTIGGEHSVSIGAIKAHSEKFKNLSVLQLDAHSDLRDEYQNSKFNHACVMARVREFCPIVQAGIRSMDICELESIERDRIFLAEDIYNDRSYISRAVEKLTDDVYITIDLDVFDPSIMPSTGTPEPGGLLWYDVLALLRVVCENKNVVGFDVVELCPNEQNKSSDFTAAKLIYKLLAYKFAF